MTNTDKATDKTETVSVTPVSAKDATHIISRRAVGPRSYERKEGVFIITRNHRIKIAETPKDVVTGDKPVIPSHLAADLVEAGVAEYFAAKPTEANATEESSAETDTTIVTPLIDAASPKEAVKEAVKEVVKPQETVKEG